jgi:hypothetical protein
MNTTSSTNTSSATPADAPSNIIELPGVGKGDRVKSKKRWSDAVMDRGHTIVPTLLFWG